MLIRLRHPGVPQLFFLHITSIFYSSRQLLTLLCLHSPGFKKGLLPSRLNQHPESPGPASAAFPCPASIHHPSRQKLLRNLGVASSMKFLMKALWVPVPTGASVTPAHCQMGNILFTLDKQNCLPHPGAHLLILLRALTFSQ